MNTSSIKNVTCATASTVAFTLVYKYYLNPVFDYAHYYWIDRGLLPLLIAAVVAVVPVLFYRGLRSISSFVAILTYTICYVPAVVTLAVALNRDVLEVLEVQLALMIGMCLFFLADRIAPGRLLTAARAKLTMQVVHGITLAFTFLVMISYWGNMQLVDFVDVYDLREAASELPVNVLVGYMVMWLTYCLYPLYMAIGITEKRWTYFLLASVGCVVIYMATGAKASLLTPLILICMFLILRMKGDLFRNVLLILSGVEFFLLLLPDDNLIAFWVKSLLFNRTLGTGGWVTYIYYEFFTEHKFTYFSHLNIVNSFTHDYPYETLGLGQVIGLQYAGTPSANFNAHFWASDGIAAMGIPGIYIINAIVFLFLVLLNLVTAKFEIRFLCLWLTGFVLGMLNLPFFTAFLSGGGLIVLLVALFVQIKRAENISIVYPSSPRKHAALARP